MPGKCDLTDGGYWDRVDVNSVQDKDQCLQSCLEKSKDIYNPAGCSFEKEQYSEPPHQCVFIVYETYIYLHKPDTIIESSGMSTQGNCWILHKGKAIYCLHTLQLYILGVA